MAQEDKKALYTLYESLKADNYDVPDTYESFERTLTAPGKEGTTNRMTLYNSLKSDNYDVPDTYESFANTLFSAKPRTETGAGASTSPTGSAQTKRQATAEAQQAATTPTTQGGSSQQTAGNKPWQPTLQDQIRMSWQLNQGMNDFKRATQARIDQSRRLAESMTQEGRNKQKAGKFQVQIAGAPTEVMGLTPPSQAPAEDQGEGQELIKRGSSMRSPVPYGVKYIDGKPVTEWLLPDGSLTTDFTEADQAEYGARKARLQHQFENRMKDNGLNPANPEDVELQAQYDAQAPAFDVVADIWQETEDQYKKDLDQNAKKNWGSYAAMGGGREARIATTGMNRNDDEVSHLSRFDLQNMMDKAWGRAGAKIYANCYSRLKQQYPNADAQELHKVAVDMARKLSDNAVYQYAVEKNTPQSTLEFFGRTVADTNLINSLGRSLARIQAGTTGDMAAYDAATAEYGKDHRVAQIGGTVVGMAIDPVTWISGGIGSAAGKGAMWAGGKLMSRLAGTTGQIGSRYLGTTLTGRLIGGMAGGAANLGAYEALKEGERQLKYGGYVNPETGQNEGYSAEAMWKQAKHGAEMGVLIGWVGPVAGNVFDPLVKGVSSTAGKVALRTGEQLSSAALEGTIFAAPDYNAMRKMSDEDFDEQYAREYGYASITDPKKKAEARKAARESAGWDIWNDSMAMMLGFKAQHGIKSAWRAVRDMAPYDAEKLGRPLTMQETAHNRQNFREHLRQALDKSPQDIAMTKDELAELHNGGYGKLASLFRKSDATVREKDPNGRERIIGDVEQVNVKYGPDGESVEDVKVSEFDGYDDMSRLMKDNRISEAARAKAYFIFTGRRLPESTIMGYRTVPAEDGSVYVQSLSAQGSVVTSRHFSSLEKAQQERRSLDRQIELNSIEIGERYKTQDVLSSATMAACEDVAAAHGETWTADGVHKAYEQAVKDLGDPEKAESVGQDSRDLVREVEEAAKNHIDEYKDETPDAIRENINKLYKVDLDHVVRKERDKRTDEEQAALDTYLRALYPEGVRQQDAMDGGSAPEESSPTQGQAAVQDAHETGSNITDPDERERVWRNMVYHEGRMHEIFDRWDFGDLLKDELGTSKPDEVIDLLPESRFSAEEQAVIADYIKARETADAVQKRMNSDTRAAVDKENAFIDKASHEDGWVRPAKMKADGREVYIVKGNVVLSEDGSMINTAASDDVIYVYNPATDKVEQTSVSQLAGLGSPTSVEETRAEMQRTIYQQNEADMRAMQGKIDAFNPGDTLVADIWGEGPAQIRVVGIQEDGMVVFEAEGKEGQFGLMPDQLSYNINLYKQQVFESEMHQQTETGSIPDDRAMVRYGDAPVAPDNEPAPSPAESSPSVPISVKYDQGDSFRVSVSGRSETQHAAVVDREGETVTIWTPFPVTDKSDKSRTMAGYTTDITRAELDAIVERNEQGELVDYVTANPTDIAVTRGRDAGMQATPTPEESVIREGISGTADGLKAGFDAERERIGNEWLDNQAVQDAMRGYAEGASSIEEIVERAKADSNDERTRQRLDTLLEFDSTRNKLQAILGKAATNDGSLSSPAGSAQGESETAGNDVPTGLKQELSPLQRLPKGVDGEPAFEQAENPEAGWDALVEYNDGDVSDAKEMADLIAEQKRKAYESAKKQKPTGTTPAQIKESKKKIKARLAQAEHEYNIWQQMAGVEKQRHDAIQAEQEAARIAAEKKDREEREAEEARKRNLDKRLRSTYEEVKDVPDAVAVLENMEPRDMLEVASLLLSGKKVLWDGSVSQVGVKQETGFGETERKKLIGLFASKENGGESLQRLAEDSMLSLCDEYGVKYDNQEARNALIEVIYRANTMSDIRNYIANNRIEEALRMADDYRRHEDALEEEWCQNTFHMSAAEYKAYEESLTKELSKAAENFDENEYFGNIADELAKRQENERRGIQESDAQREGASDGRGSEVLSSQGIDTTQGRGTDAKGSAVPEGNGDQVVDQERPVPESSSGGEREIASIGIGKFGQIFAAFRGKAKDAWRYLSALKSGQARGVFYRPEIGEIDLVWGDAPTPYSGKGLAHIDRKHVETLGDFSSMEEAIDIIDDVVRNGEIKDEQTNTIAIEKDGYRVVIARDESGNWVLTAFDAATSAKEKKKRKDAATSDTPGQPNAGAGAVAPNLSYDKDNTLSPRKQENSEESSTQSPDSKGEQSVQSAVEAASAEVNTSPTPAQKEAGNYKKGHVTIGEFDITIENPAGSVRKNVDADGKEWSTTMANTYGYIKGTEGVDGDHIDVFLHSDMDQWNGRKVFVIDQTNPDGSFDEHKVMLGFNDKDEAMAAYLANYDKTWADTHPGLRISETNIEDFNKWVQSSHRKTKPFAEYKSVKPIEAQSPGIDMVGSLSDLKNRLFNEEVAKLPEWLRPAVNNSEYSDYPEIGSISPEEYAKWIEAASTPPEGPGTVELYEQVKGGTPLSDAQVEQLRSLQRFHALKQAKSWLQRSASRKQPGEYVEYDKNGNKLDEWGNIVAPAETTKGYELDVYETKKGKKFHRVKFPRADKEVWKERLDIAKEQFGGTSVPGGYGFKDAETAKAFADAILHPVSAEGLKERTDAIDETDHTSPTGSAQRESDHVASTEQPQEMDDNPYTPGRKLSDELRRVGYTTDRELEVGKRYKTTDGDELEVAAISGASVTFRLYEEGKLKSTHQEPYLAMFTLLEPESEVKETPEPETKNEQAEESEGNGIQDKLDELWVLEDNIREFGDLTRGELEADGSPWSYDELQKQRDDAARLRKELEQEAHEALAEQDRQVQKSIEEEEAYQKAHPEEYEPNPEPAKQEAEPVKPKKKATRKKKAAPKQKPEPDPAQAETEKKARSKWFNEEDQDEAADIIRKMKARLRGGNLYSGIPIDVELLELGCRLGYLIMKKGARKLQEYARAMIENLGDGIRPYVKQFYNATLATEEALEGEWYKDATPMAEIAKFDMVNFLKEKKEGIIETAKGVVAEQEVKAAMPKAAKGMVEKRHNLAILGYFKPSGSATAGTKAERAGYVSAEKKASEAGADMAARLVDDLGLDLKDLPEGVRLITADFGESGGRISINLPIRAGYEPIRIGIEFEKTEGDALRLTELTTTMKRGDDLAYIIGEDNQVWDRSPIYDELKGSIREQMEKYLPKDGRAATPEQAAADVLTGGKKKVNKPKEEAPSLFDEPISQTPAPQRPKNELSGDSIKEQDRRNAEYDFVEAVSNELIQRINNEGSPLTMAEVHKMAEERGMKDVSPTDLQELVERAVSLRARSIAEHTLTGGPGTQEIGFNKIVKLYTTQPVLSDRDVERIQRQQYSTPVPMGYVMDQFMMSHGLKGKRLLEPSAGNGALTIGVPKDNCHVNDIDPRRLANLRAIGFKVITNQDALQPFEGQYDMVVTNPPFGTAPSVRTYDGLFEISTLEGQMAINALDSMTDDGRAAIIVGGSIGKWPTPYEKNGRLQKVADRQFFGYLYSHYNVVDIIPIDGKSLYSRNGTGYNVRMILIDGRRRDAEGNVIREVNAENRVFPPVKEEARPEAVTTYDELYKRVQDDILRIQQRLDVATRNDGGYVEGDGAVNPSDAPVANPAGDRGGERPVGTGDSSRTPRSGLGGTTSGGTSTRPGTDERPTGDRKPSGSTHGDTGGTDRRPVDERPKSEGGHNELSAVEHMDRPGDRGGVRHGATDTDGGAQRHNPDGARQRGGSGPERLNQPTPVKVELTDEKVASPHVSSSNQLQSRMPAAQALEFERALHSIEEKHGNVDEWLTQELGYADTADLYRALAAEQVEGVAMAIDKMNSGRGFIIADQTGIGKGRQAASIIRYAVRNGHKPIFVTQKAGLFSDMYRDLKDIGSPELRPFIFGSDKKTATITERQEDGTDKVIFALPTPKERDRVYSYIEQHGTLPDEYDYAVTTYSQVQNGTTQYEIGDNGKIEAKPKNYKGKVPAGDITGERRRHVVDLLSRGNYLILDEAHTAGGQSGLGGYMQNIIPGVKGITYLSATYAKRPDNMPLYAIKTAISDSGVEVAELINAVAQGGVPLQEIMSRQLVKSGEMARRERDFTGVNIDWIPTDEGVAREQQKRFDTVSEIFVDIMRFQDTYVRPYLNEMSKDLARVGSSSGQKKGTKDMGIGNAPFASKLYNLLQQLLFSIKVDAVADRAIKNLQNGRKPIISFVNTMEGFLEEASTGITEDGSASMPTLSLALRKALDGVMRYTIKDDNNNETHSALAASQLGPDAETAYNAIIEKMNAVSDDLPIAPLDAIRLKIEAAGYKVGELSGRKLELAKNDKGLYVIRNRKASDKKATASDFNAGKIDVLMVNKTGSTGISLHASSKFVDQRQRVMIAAQFQPDVNDEVQMRGRNDRTGQVVRGAYEYLLSSIPAEQRLQMMFKAKLKSLDANTTSSQKSSFNEMEVVDVLNKYGDAIVWDYLNEDPMGLNMDMGNPLGIDPNTDVETQQQEVAKKSRNDDEDGSHSGFARKALGRLALLSIAEQERVMSEITDRYEKKIHELDERGENDLEISYRDLKAKTLGRKVWVEGKDPDSGNAFADNVYMEKVEVNILDKPLSGTELARYHRTFLEDAGVETWDEWLDKKTTEIDAFYENRIASVRERIITNKEATIARRKDKFIKTAKEARALGKNSFTDEEIVAEANSRYGETERQEAKAEIEREAEKIRIQQSLIKRRLTQAKPMSPLSIPDDLADESSMDLNPSTGVMVGIKLDSKYSLNGSTVVFAPLDGRRTITLSLKEAGVAFSKIGQATMMMRDVLRNFDLSQWDSHISNESRETRYMLTGNILRALVDMQKTQNARGRITAYTTEDGEVRTGILMSPKFTPGDLQSSAPLSSMLSKIMAGEEVKSSNGEVTVRRTRGWSPRGEYELLVPKSKQHGGKYFMPDQDPVLAGLVAGGFDMPRSGSQAIGYIHGEDLARVLDHLSTKHGASVMLSSKLKEISEDGIEYRTPEEGIAYVNARAIQPWSAELDELRFRRDKLDDDLPLWERQRVRDLGEQEKAWEEKWAAEHTDTDVPTGRRSRFEFYANQYGQGELSYELGRAKRESGRMYDSDGRFISANARDMARRAIPAIMRRRADLLADRPSFSRAGQAAIDAELADLEYMALYYQRMEDGEDVDRTMPGRIEHQRMLATAREVAESLGEKVVLYEAPGDIYDSDYSRRMRKQRSYGWYNPNDGTIHVNISRHRNAQEVIKTVMHEIVGHKTIEQIMGPKRFARMIDEIWNHAGKKVRAKIAEKMRKNGWDFREATKEYLGELAEKVHTKGYETLEAEQKTFWQRVKAKIQDFLNRILEGLKIPARIRLTENDLSYMMWKLYKHKERKAARAGKSGTSGLRPQHGEERMDIFDKAEEIVRREEWERDGNSLEIAARSKDAEMRYTSPEPEYRPRQKPAPRNTIKVYKLVRIKDDRPGEWFPLFIDSAAPLRLGEWLDADSPDLEMLRGREPGQYLVNPQTKEVLTREEVYQQHPELRSMSRGHDTKYPSVDAINYATDNGLRWMEIEETDKAQRRFDGENRRYWNLGINGSGSVSTFSMRPGWHAGSLPTMRQIGKGKNKDLRDDNFVWVEGEVSADVDYQAEAERNPDKDLPDRIPEDGFYMKATNANKTTSQADRVGWYVAGSFKANRFISDAEARQIIDDFNAAHPDMDPVAYDYDRESGRTYDPEAGLHFRDGDETSGSRPQQGEDMTVEERTLKMQVALAERHAEDVAVRDAAVEALGKTLGNIRKAMAVQRTYDFNTVRSLGAVADILISSGTFLPEGPGEVKRLYGIMKRGIGHAYTDKNGVEHVAQSEKDYNAAVESLMDLFVSNQLKLSGKFLDEVMKIRGSKVNARGVEVIGDLDVEGQIMVRGMKEYMNMDVQSIHDRIDALDEIIANGNDAASINAAAEKMGLELAEQYADEVADRIAQEKIMRDELRDMTSQWDPTMSGDARKAYTEQKRALRESIRKIRIERADAMRQLASQVGNELRNSIERVKAFREREKQRIEEIWHNANSDMTGRPFDEHGMKKKGLGVKLSNNMVSRLLLAPAATFEQIMRVFGSKSIDGEGYLFDRYVRGWQECRDKEWTSTQEVEGILDRKAAEILGKRKARWSDLYALTRKEAGSCDWWDGGQIREHKVTQGNLMYIYMVNKMTDGQVKLRRMCITDDKMQEIEQALDPKLKAVADWLQEELLPNLRNKYNDVHQRMFGAPMAEIENYFPLKILANARLEEVEMVGKIDGKDLPKTMTGAIIKRRFNNYALDVLNSDAVSIALDHIREMETWATFAEYRRDLCTLLSYKHFRNQVKNMSTIYGSGEKFWDKFYDLSLLVGGAYQPKTSEFDKVAVNITKLATGACIAIRLNTALKQTLSYPAFAHDANIFRLFYNLTPWRMRACWKWAMENMPSFQRRWKSRQAGNDVLRPWKFDWDWTRSEFVQKVQRAGITPNAFIDALTVAMGSEAVYQSKLKGYLKDGFGKEEAHRRAIMDAEIIFNLSQQSSELPYLSLLQNDRSYLTTCITNFRNSPMSYLRQSIQSKRELANMVKSKGIQIEFETKKGVREGLTQEQAKARAERKYKRNWVRNIFKSSTFDYILPVLWAFGLSGMWYCIFGDDDKKKQQYAEDAMKRGMLGGLEGFTFGGTLPDFVYGLATGGKPQLDEETSPAMGLVTDMANLYSNGKTERAANEMINTMIALGVGVNPQVLEDGVVAGMDFFGEDEKSARDWALLFMRVIQCPQSQMDQVYFDELGMDAREASRKSPAELAERYATYKARRANFATMWAYDDNRWEGEVKESWRKKFEKEAKDRLEGQSDEHVNEGLEKYDAEWSQTGKRLKELREQSGDISSKAAKARVIFESPEGTRYKLYNDMHPDLDKMIKSWLSAPTAQEAAADARAIVEYKAKVVEMLDSWDNPEKSGKARREARGIVKEWRGRKQNFGPAPSVQ